jgi:uncharacterized protein (DUF2141 family)
MKALFFFSCLFLFPFSKSKLTVEVKSIPNDKGTIFIGLFRPKDQFPIFGKQYIGKVIPVSGKNMSYLFNDLSDGKYAVAVFHDENKNGKLDKNYLGIPTEAYGFSNNARRTFSAPSFEEAEVNLKSDLTISIMLK